MFRTLILTAAAASLISISARAADPSPAIAGITLGMTREEVTSILQGLKETGEKEAGKPAKLSTYSTSTSDGTDRFTIAQALVIEYPNRPKDALRRTDKDRIVVVFGEFNERVVSVMRGQFFAKQKPDPVSVEAAIKDTYGITLDQTPPFKANVRFGLLMHDKDGKITTDKQCAQTTLGTQHPQSGPSPVLEGFGVWNVLYAHCGVLLKVRMHREGKPLLVDDLEQEMIDTQAMIADRERSQEARRTAEEARKRKTLDDAKKVVPKL